MKTLKLRLTGTDGTPIILHNNQAVDPLNIYSKAIKVVTKKRNKTDEDHELLARMEWEVGLYVHDGVLVLPARCIYASLAEAARKSKDGKNVKQGVRMGELYYPLKCRGVSMNDLKLPQKVEDIPSPSFEKYYKEVFIDRRPVVVQRNTIMRTRPIFHNWSVECSVFFDEQIFEKETLLGHFKTAGIYCGLCDYRPQYGSFGVEEIS